MTISHLKADPSKVISWASGTSTEIFIYPPTSDFQTRDFLFRISTATVDEEETVFTRLSNITRTLMVLEGNLILTHEGQYNKSMFPFDQDNFQGDWNTKSKGMVTNFNLMCKDGTSGTIKQVSASNQSKVTFDLKADFELLYLQSGKANYDGTTLEAGDCLVVEAGQGNQIPLSCHENCNFIQTSITIKGINEH